jgi:hypothetical protein
VDLSIFPIARISAGSAIPRGERPRRDLLFHYKEEMEVAVGKMLLMEEPSFFLNGSFKFVSRWNNVSVPSGIILEMIMPQ